MWQSGLLNCFRSIDDWQQDWWHLHRGLGRTRAYSGLSRFWWSIYLFGPFSWLSSIGLQKVHALSKPRTIANRLRSPRTLQRQIPLPSSKLLWTSSKAWCHLEIFEIPAYPESPITTWRIYASFGWVPPRSASLCDSDGIAMVIQVVCIFMCFQDEPLHDLKLETMMVLRGYIFVARRQPGRCREDGHRDGLRRSSGREFCRAEMYSVFCCMINKHKYTVYKCIQV